MRYNHKGLLIRFGLLCGVCCLALSVVLITAWAVGEAPPQDDEMTLLFQELTFSQPTDRFLLAEFDSDSGVIGKVKAISDDSAETYADTLVFDEVEQRRGFVIASTDHYTLFLERQEGPPENAYVLAVLDRGAQKEVHGLPRFTWAGLGTEGGDALYYARDWSLRRLPLIRAGEEDIVASEVTAFAVHPETSDVWLFHVNGEIEVRSVARSGIRARFQGVVAEAGFVDSTWIWFYQRRSEHAGGALYLLNIVTGRIKKSNARLPHCRLIKVFARDDRISRRPSTQDVNQ